MLPRGRPGAVARASLALGAALAIGCGPTDAPPGSTSSGAAASGAAASGAPAPSAKRAPVDPDRPPWLGAEGPKERFLSVVNPKGEAPYDGPKATLEGRVRMKGDAPPETTLAIPDECAKGRETYGKLFRVSPEGDLADVLVAVTGYDAYVPPVLPAVKVDVERCAFSRRTVAMTFGQRIEVSNLDASTPYMPYLDGAAFKAVMVAVPRGAPLTLTPHAPGQYLLRDTLKRPFMLADVFVLKFATTAVTGLDGRFVIEGLPVGKVRVDALLPVLRKTTGREIELSEGKNEVSFELTYDAKVDLPVKVPEPVWGTRVPEAPAAGSSAEGAATPSASPSAAPAPLTPR